MAFAFDFANGDYFGKLMGYPAALVPMDDAGKS
jgi:hypothetical protein